MKNKSIKDKTILLVEDEQSLIKTVSKKLRGNGFNVLTANSVKEALSHLEKLKEIKDIAVVFLQRNKTVLVIEDEQPLVEAIKGKLENNGFSVVTARSVKQALSYLENIKEINMIWLDHYLSGKETGIDFIIELKNNGNNLEKVPIFVVSNNNNLRERQLYLDLGIDRYYSKADYSLEQIVAEVINS